MNKKKLLFFLFFIPFFAISMGKIGLAENSDVSRTTLAGIQGVQVIVEDLQPNLQKYASKYGLTAVQIRQEVEQKLTQRGVRVVKGSEWLKVPGRPVLYINFNTHETEKYWYAYDVKVELRQVVQLEANPKVKAFADTWSTNMTGMANIGNLYIIKNDMMVLVEGFAQAYKSLNKLK